MKTSLRITRHLPLVTLAVLAASAASAAIIPVSPTQGKTVTLAEARALLKFAQKEKRPAHSLGEAMDGTAI